jgi:hypothetical protein
MGRDVHGADAKGRGRGGRARVESGAGRAFGAAAAPCAGARPSGAGKTTPRVGPACQWG